MYFRVPCFHQQKQSLMHADADACSNCCHLQVSNLCLFSEQKQKQHIKNFQAFSACTTASNMLVQDHIVRTCYSVHSCSPVIYYAASKLPASAIDSLPLTLYRHAQRTSPFSSNAKRHSVSFCLGFWFLVWSFLFVLFFSEWFDTVSHTMVRVQERGHMHIDDIVQHADKFQVTLCSQKTAFLTRFVRMQMAYVYPAQNCPALNCPACTLLTMSRETAS